MLKPFSHFKEQIESIIGDAPYKVRTYVYGSRFILTSKDSKTNERLYNELIDSGLLFVYKQKAQPEFTQYFVRNCLNDTTTEYKSFTAVAKTIRAAVKDILGNATIQVNYTTSGVSLKIDSAVNSTSDCTSKMNLFISTINTKINTLNAYIEDYYWGIINIPKYASAPDIKRRADALSQKFN